MAGTIKGMRISSATDKMFAVLSKYMLMNTLSLPKRYSSGKQVINKLVSTTTGKGRGMYVMYFHPGNRGAALHREFHVSHF